MTTFSSNSRPGPDKKYRTAEATPTFPSRYTSESTETSREIEKIAAVVERVKESLFDIGHRTKGIDTSSFKAISLASSKKFSLIFSMDKTWTAHDYANFFSKIDYIVTLTQLAFTSPKTAAALTSIFRNDSYYYLRLKNSLPFLREYITVKSCQQSSPGEVNFDIPFPFKETANFLHKIICLYLFQEKINESMAVENTKKKIENHTLLVHEFEAQIHLREEQGIPMSQPGHLQSRF